MRSQPVDEALEWTQWQRVFARACDGIDVDHRTGRKRQHVEADRFAAVGESDSVRKVEFFDLRRYDFRARGLRERCEVNRQLIQRVMTGNPARQHSAVTQESDGVTRTMSMSVSRRFASSSNTTACACPPPASSRRLTAGNLQDAPRT